jgi:hypothetical protein
LYSLCFSVAATTFDFAAAAAAAVAQIFLPVVRGRLSLLEELAFRFVERQSAQSVIYTEVRYSPHLLAEDGFMVGERSGGDAGVDDDEEKEGGASKANGSGQGADRSSSDRSSSPLGGVGSPKLGGASWEHVQSEHASSPPSPNSKSSSSSNNNNNSAGGYGSVADAEAVLAAVTAGLRRGERRFGVTVNQILCCLAFRPDWAVSLFSNYVYGGGGGGDNDGVGCDDDRAVSVVLMMVRCRLLFHEFPPPSACGCSLVIDLRGSPANCRCLARKNLLATFFFSPSVPAHTLLGLLFLLFSPSSSSSLCFNQPKGGRGSAGCQAP